MGDRDRRARGPEPPALERRDHRRRLPQPAEDPRDRGQRRPSAAPSWHTARWPEDVDLDGQARRRDRHRLHRLPDGPRARARRRAGGRVPAHAAVAVRRAGLPLAVPAARSTGSTATSRTTRTSCALRTLGTGKAFWRSTEIDPDFDDPYTVQPAQQARRARPSLDVPAGASSARPGAARGDDAGAPAVVGARGDRRQRLLRRSTPSCATT